METVDTSKRLASLRQLMQEHKVDVYIVPSEDSHQSEYIAPCDGRREFISGFTGSAGTAIISLNEAALSTDGRYFNQAGKQLDNNWTLLKRGVEGVPTWQEWITQQSEGGKVVGVDPALITAAAARNLSDTLKKNNSSLVGVPRNLVDAVWGEDRPAPPREKVRVHPEKYAGKSFQEKVSDLRKELENKKAAGFVISMLDEIAWLLNLRGNDIPYNPVFFSYCIVTPTTVELYIEDEKLTPEVKAHLGGDVIIKPYEYIFADVKALSDAKKHDPNAPPAKFLLSNRASWALNLSLGGEDYVEETRSPIGDAKAVKNEVELAGMRACHIRDGAALIEYFAWLENELVNKKTTLDEVDAADKLEQCRSKHDLFAGLSFDTISSTGPNGAIIHYKPEKGSCSVIDPNAIYLCDSGGQYLDGTTDVTRTFHFGQPTELEKKAFTLVLKGLIGLDSAVFPKGTSGFALDVLARQHLWKEGLDFLHGTGHGIGSYLNVHEGPVGIGTRVQYTEVPLAPGNVISDEPGFYEDGKFGIRIENVIMVREVETTHKFGERPWLGFEHVTLCPIGLKLIEPSLLSDSEIKWVNDYHAEVWEKTQNGRSGYPNGYGYPENSRYERSDGGYGNDSGLGPNGYGPGGGGRDRRPGGYGGFYSEPSQQPSLPLHPSPERRRDRFDRDDRSYSSSRSRTRGPDLERERRLQSSRDGGPRGDASRLGNTGGGGGGGGERSGGGSQAVEDVLQLIQREWDFVATDDCVPVQVALQLMDTSTLGKADRESGFLDTHQRIQQTLKTIVNEHHQGFNSSIGTYHKIQSSIQSSQGRVRNLRHALENAKAGLMSTKPELKDLATSSQKYDDIIQLFSQIQEIQSLPEKLESRLSDKRFLGAVEVLHDALRLLRRSELENIGALADIRAYFETQESSITDILVEELHDHLYLKSPYCADRWKPPNPETESTGANGAGPTSWERPVYGFLARLDASKPMVEDASRNPEADTFAYMQLLIESLNKMGHLDIAVDRIEQRLPVELFTVVDKTNAEIDIRYPLPRGSMAQDGKASSPTELIEKRGHVLSEFLWTLYAKFESIAEGHRVVHDVIAAIVEREGIPKSNALAGGFKELWKLYQSEIRSLMHDYLATDGDFSIRPTDEEADTRRQLYSSYRDKSKKLFKLSETGRTTEMRAEQNELDEILRSSVPGLVSKSEEKGYANKVSESRQGTGHKILIEPSVFNMSLLLPPSLFFIQRLKDIVPVDSDMFTGSLTSFLDDFLVNVFLPQLDETVTELCTLSFIAPDAFTEDPQWSAISPRPVFKGTVKFMSIVREFSKMLSSIPHDQAFTQLLLGQIVTYYDKCFGWYKSIVMKIAPRGHGGVRLKAAAAFAESGPIHDIVAELWRGSDTPKWDLIDRETGLLIKQTNQTPLEPVDIISDSKSVVALSLLHNSMQWLASNLAKLRQPVTDTRPTQSESGTSNRRWTLIGAMRPKRDSISHPVYLPLNQETNTAFDTTLQSLRDLALTSIFALHIDIRCGVIHMLTRTMTGPNVPVTRNSEPTTPSPPPSGGCWHLLTSQPTAASPSILELNKDLIAFDTNVSSYLGSAQRRFITSGLARFIDQVFVSSTRYIWAMNENGALRLQLDVLVLQQNLKNIIVDSDEVSDEANPAQGAQHHREVVALPRSAKFLDWFLEGAEKALDYAKEEKEYLAANGGKAPSVDGDPFSYEELKVLVDLGFSEVLRGPKGEENREDFMAAKKASADALLRLNEIMWDSK
ncbi:exocyst subunit SEC8 [Aspergillus lucknowensis]|uniref:Probable Xaa-Pro aminopeptidase P n=1 Tax=Aspergillus lucknowensis TaxID=176173 RepID=A0ABR4LUJ2_9EURO